MDREWLPMFEVKRKPLPNPRTVNHKLVAKARKHRKAIKQQKRHMAA